MSNSNPPSNNEKAKSWDSYWQGDTLSHAYSSSGVNHSSLTAYWQEFFKELSLQRSNTTMVDIASGNGALPELAFSAFDPTSINITAVDISAAAIDNIIDRFPSITGVVADAKNLDFGKDKFDLVSSQFGIEYAGIDAIDVAIDLVKPTGILNFMLHTKGGEIEQECQANKNALLKLIETNFITLSRNMFAHGFEAVAGADRKPYDEAAIKLNSTLPAIEKLIENYGEGICGGLIVKLYSDIGNIHSRMPHYNSNDVLPWLDTMHSEVAAYLNRMQSMLDAALGHHEINLICEKLKVASFALEESKAIQDPITSQPLAWVIRASKTV